MALRKDRKTLKRGTGDVTLSQFSVILSSKHE